ncbi:hypothetical protein U1Q18_010178, partial [Sarracenia purpurea var. burkii]
VSANWNTGDWGFGDDDARVSANWNAGERRRSTQGFRRLGKTKVGEDEIAKNMESRRTWNREKHGIAIWGRRTWNRDLGKTNMES